GVSATGPRNPHGRTDRLIGVSTLNGWPNSWGQISSPALLYLFWEPTNWNNFDEFKRHRDEVERFSAAMSGDVLRFEALSYLELWEDWQRTPSPDWLSQHMKNLLARYAVEI
ncbi:MAG: hypothetical protein RL768_2749, partial [Nitrospirota bacterium]